MAGCTSSCADHPSSDAVGNPEYVLTLTYAFSSAKPGQTGSFAVAARLFRHPSPSEPGRQTDGI
jgi:hypothetical protein